MNRDDIIRLAREAGFTWEPINNIIGPLERFAALAAAHEREECAKVCEAISPSMRSWRYYDACRDAAAAIRARGEA